MRAWARCSCRSIGGSRRPSTARCCANARRRCSSPSRRSPKRARPPASPRRARRVAIGNAPALWADWDALLAQAHAPAPVTPADPADPVTALLLCFTSGSTGQPKGVLLSARALEANADASVDMHAMTADDRVLTTLPFHVGGLNIQTTPALRCGGTVTLHPRFDADAVFDAIARERITLTVLVPAQLEAMIAHPRWATADFTSLRAISTGSTVVPQHLIAAVHARGVPLIQVWARPRPRPSRPACTPTSSRARRQHGPRGARLRAAHRSW